MVASAGRRPKIAKLRLVEGTRDATRHPSEQELIEQAKRAKEAFRKPVKPDHLTGEAEWAWNRYIVPCWWLDGSREAVAIGFCELWKEFRRSPVEFSSPRHGQLRAYMQELGLTDERNRIVHGENQEDEFLD